VSNLRVLAVRAEPVNPGLGATTTLDALVYAPDAEIAQTADPSFTYAWSWCPRLGNPNDGFPCPVDEEQLQQLAATARLVDLPPLSLGADPTSAFRNPFPGAVLAHLCDQGYAGTPADCRGGFPVRVKVTVAHGGVERTATMILRLPITDDAASNANPRFEPGGPALGALMAGVEQPIDEQAAVTLPRLKETDLRAHVSDAEAESYVGLDDDDTVAVLRERLVLSWYVETGDVTADSFHTGYFPGLTDIGQFLSNKWKPGKQADFPLDHARLIVVLRDNRGGVSWASGVVGLEAAP
jgi:hypothetical protein